MLNDEWEFSFIPIYLFNSPKKRPTTRKLLKTDAQLYLHIVERNGARKKNKQIRATK